MVHTHKLINGVPQNVDVCWDILGIPYTVFEHVEHVQLVTMFIYGPYEPCQTWGIAKFSSAR